MSTASTPLSSAQKATDGQKTEALDPPGKRPRSSETTFLPSIDEGARRRFEVAWTAGRPEEIEKCLPAPEHPHYLATLEELLVIQLEFVWKAFGSTLATASEPLHSARFVEDFLARFPCLRDPDILLRLLRQEYLVRHRYADCPSTAEYRRRFPELVPTGNELDIRAEEANNNSFQADGYAIQGVVGRGGMGIVYKAAQSGLNRIVALKKVRNPNLASSDRERFIGEAKISAILEHPGVVPIYELATPPGSEPYYTMKLVRGQTLEQAIRRLHLEQHSPGELAIAQRRLLSIFLAVARTMGFAHSRGVIHRDLKPANVVLGDYGETVILDWGLAKVLSGFSTPLLSEATLQGSVLGTPAYMSPEQAAGQIDKIDERSDIYALGTILYQILTGHPPFSGDVFEILQRIHRDDPVRPRVVDPKIPRPLEAICVRALAKKPEDRYQAVAELERDLESYLAGEPVTAYRESGFARLNRWARRRRTLVATGSVALLLLIAGGIAALFLNQKAEQDRQRQAFEFEQRRQRQAFEFEQSQQQQAREHRLTIKTAAEGDEALALAEMHADHFANAERILHKAAAALAGDDELADLRRRIKDRREQAYHLAEFYRLWDRGERLAATATEMAFVNKDQDALVLCETALKHLGVLDATGVDWWSILPVAAPGWWNRLPTKDLLPEQRDRLKDDVARTLCLTSLWHTKKGFMQSFFPGGNDLARKSYQSARDVARLIQLYAFEHYDKQPSAAAEIVDHLCICFMKDRSQLKRRHAKPISGFDHYFLGTIYMFISDTKKGGVYDIIKQRVPMEELRLSGLDLDSPPLATAERHLRNGIALTPRHYWGHYWLGLCQSMLNFPVYAELSYDTCVGLRPDYLIGYQYRTAAVLTQVNSTEPWIQWARKPFPISKATVWKGAGVLPFVGGYKPPIDLLLNGVLAAQFTQYRYWNNIQDERKSRALKGIDHAPIQLQHDPVLRALRAACLTHLSRWNEAIEDYALAVELEAAQQLLDKQLVSDGGRSAAGVREYLENPRPFPELEKRAALAVAYLAEKNDEKAASHLGWVLQRPGSQAHPRAIATRGMLALRAGKLQDALADFDAALVQRPQYLFALFGRVHALEQLKDWAATVATYDQIISIAGPGRGDTADWRHQYAFLGKARAHANLRQTTEARIALEDARQIDASAADVLASQLFPAEKR